MDGDVNDKVVEYERFVNEKLKEDLKKIHLLRDQSNAKTAEYVHLKNMMEQLIANSETKQDFRTMVDLGRNFYCQAKVNKEQNTVFVAVGFGFFVEMTYQEALRFADKKLRELSLEAEKLSKKSAQTKAHIKLALQGLMELQSLNFTQEEARRDLL